MFPENAQSMSRNLTLLSLALAEVGIDVTTTHHASGNKKSGWIVIDGAGTRDVGDAGSAPDDEARIGRHSAERNKFFRYLWEPFGLEARPRPRTAVRNRATRGVPVESRVNRSGFGIPFGLDSRHCVGVVPKLAAESLRSLFVALAPETGLTIGSPSMLGELSMVARSASGLAPPALVARRGRPRAAQRAPRPGRRDHRAETSGRRRCAAGGGVARARGERGPRLRSALPRAHGP